MANHARALALTPSDREELERLQRSPSSPAGLCRRARAILLMADKVTGTEVARLTDYTPVQISRIRRRFAEDGVAGLADRARSGRPPRLGEAKGAQIVALTLQAPPQGLTHWSTRDMAQRVGVSHATVHRLWQAHALQPHRLESFTFTHDPRAESKIRDVVGVYLHPPTHAVVLSLDEKTQIQALERTQPELPLRPNRPARQTHDYRRHGLASLYAALEVATGRVLGECSARHTGADFVRFLDQVYRRYRRRELHVILDNSSTHSTPQVHQWLEAHPNVQFHFTPTGTSWLNLIEAWFGILTRKSVRRANFVSVPAPGQTHRPLHRALNEHPTPFVWTKSPAQIIRKTLHRGH